MWKSQGIGRSVEVPFLKWRRDAVLPVVFVAPSQTIVVVPTLRGVV